MTPHPGTSEEPLRVAIVGSGPSGFYAAQHLLARKDVAVTVDLFERLPTPFGLVRYGVAPDHQKIKSVTKSYTRTAQLPGFRFFGNVEVGSAITLGELRHHYHQVIFTTGAQTDRRLGIPGEDLRGSHPATEFVAWYNGHPDFIERSFDLSHERAVVVGVGNVAVDVARVLCRTADELARTDIAEPALEQLRRSRIREVLLVGRRGPAQAAFTNTELKELGKLADADAVTLEDEVELDAVTREFLEEHPSKTTDQKVEVLRSYAGRTPTKKKRLVIRFLVSPAEIHGDDRGAVRGVRLVRNRLERAPDGSLKARPTDDFEDIEAGIVFRSVGYRGVPIPGIPFDDGWGIVPNEKGRVVDPAQEGAPVRGIYVAGWIKRGPTGVIGTNKPDALETVEAMLEDLRAGRTITPAQPDPEAIPRLLDQRGVRRVTFADWERLDAIEVERGTALERPRVKFLTTDAMTQVLDQPTA